MACEIEKRGETELKILPRAKLILDWTQTTCIKARRSSRPKHQCSWNLRLPCLFSITTVDFVKLVREWSETWNNNQIHTENCFQRQAFVKFSFTQSVYAASATNGVRQLQWVQNGIYDCPACLWIQKRLVKLVREWSETSNSDRIQTQKDFQRQLHFSDSLTPFYFLIPVNLPTNDWQSVEFHRSSSLFFLRFWQNPKKNSEFSEI